MENTSHIASIAYQIEIWLYKGYSKENIIENIIDLQEHNEFPSNLVLVDLYFDEVLGSSGCAFLDTNTGETIVGFAGTNWDNGKEEGLKDLGVDLVGIGITGIAPDSPYFNATHKFMKRLEHQGYNVTQITGHSLGGALAVMIGLIYNTPSVVTYNGAPVYGLGSADSGGIYDALYAKYKGEIHRFVSESDFLNPLMDGIRATYYGDKIELYNKKDHNMGYFLEAYAQNFIESLLVLKRKFDDQELAVDFDGDGIADLILNTAQLQTKNLLVDSNSPNFKRVLKIEPDSFAFLAANLRQDLVERDMAWIRQALQLCQNQNNQVKHQRLKRETDLQEKVLIGLKEAHLTHVLGNIEATHGVLSQTRNINILTTLSSFNTYAITRNFDNWGSSAGREWFIGGEPFNVQELIRWIKNLKSSAFDLVSTITDVGYYEHYDNYSAHTRVYHHDTMSKIAKSFVDVTNTFLGKVEQVFPGTGKRTGMQDGMVEAIDEVLAVEFDNVTELETKIAHLAELAQGIADNFLEMDVWLGEQMNSKRIQGNPFLKPIPADYQTYLKVHEVFDDVKDVLEAYDIQVEQATQKLSRLVVQDFSELITRSKTSLDHCDRSLQQFREALAAVVELFELPITSSYTYHIDPEFDGISEPVIKQESHGTLAHFFTDEIVEAAHMAMTSIAPLLTNFNASIMVLDMYDSNLTTLRHYFNTVIETAVYDSMGLAEIIKSHELISSLLSRMVLEINNVAQTIAVEYQGQSLERYQEKLGSVSQLLIYYDQMIDDCFGDKQNPNQFGYISRQEPERLTTP